MASSSSTQATLFSYSPPQWTYDVFLSFRGKDTRNTFTSHLYTNLKQSGIDVYMDDSELGRGKTIEPALWKAIEESRFSVVIFSRDYASSPWCLDELVKIVQCMKEMGHTVLPIFHDVDPSEVAEQKGKYMEAFVEHEKVFRENLEKVQIWKDCLSTVANLSGWDVRNRAHARIMLGASESGPRTVPLGPMVERNLVGQVIEENKNVIWYWLTTDESVSIGIYGTSGVGKTALATYIHNQLLKRPDLFLYVYWIPVTIERDTCMLQNLIAKKISLDLSGVRGEERRAAKLHKALITKQKSVLILDNLWYQYPLDKIGIPVRASGLKVVFTMRTCFQLLDCQKKITVEPLSEEDAWILFTKKLGHDKPFPPELEQIAKSIVSECAGLPIGIMAMAGSLREVNDACGWRNALEELKEAKAREGYGKHKVFSVLRFCYNRLNDSTLQQCLLHCASLPRNDALIPRKSSMRDAYFAGEVALIPRESLPLPGERLIQVSITKRLKEYYQYHAMLNRLENAYLLERVTVRDQVSKYTEYVKMQDMIRHFVLQLRKKDKAGKKLEESPKEEQARSCQSQE